MARDRAESIKHESFGAIGAFHVSGNHKLFMSPHKHQHFVTVRITTATVRRELSNDYFFGEREIIAEVHMSEAQWAHFVSAPNQGSGSPCTIGYYRDGELKKVEPPPDHAGHRETFAKELREHAANALKGVRSALGALDRVLAGGPVSKAAIKEIRHDLSMAMENDIDAGMGFVLQQGEEWVDRVVEAGKTELEAHQLAGLRGLALESISSHLDPKAKERLLKGITAATGEQAEGARGVAAPPILDNDGSE